MKKDYISHLFVPPKKSDTESISDVIDDKLLRLFGRKKSLRKTVKDIAYYSAKRFYDVIREFPSGKGYADLVFLPRPRHAEKSAIIIELKWNQDAKAAIQQIKEKGYVQALEAYKGRILLVGIAYDKLTRRHVCEIEEYHMDA